MMEKIYLDNNATTSLDQRIFKAMLADLSGPPLNPSSIHSFGRKAKGMLVSSRDELASFFQGKPEEITFSSGATESNNLILRSLPEKGHLITTHLDHSSAYNTIQVLEKEGLDVAYLPVGLWGAPTPEQIEEAIRPDTKALFLSASNAETGVKLDIEGVAAIAEKKQIPFFLDAVAYLGKEELPIFPGITSISCSGHKMHAAKGVGALFCRSGYRLKPVITGSMQEFHRRAGTENLAGILGLAEAIRILKREQTEITNHLRHLRDHLETNLMRHLPDVVINGEGPRICNTSNLAFLGVDGETLLMQLDLAGIAASHGSACSSGAMEPSRVLTKMGIDQKIARSSVRFSVGKFNTQEEVDQAIDRISHIVTNLRKIG